MTHVTVSEAKGGSVINDSVEKEIGSLAWLGYSPPGLGFRTPEDRSGSVSPKRAHIPLGSDAPCLWEGRERVRARWGWRDLVCPNCRHSAAGSITTAVGLFLQSLRLSAQTAVPAESTLGAEREEWMTLFYV